MSKTTAALIAPLLAATGAFAQTVTAEGQSNVFFAQAGPAVSAPGPDVMFKRAGEMGTVIMAGAPGAVGFVSRDFSVMGKPVTGAPYSATETTESIQTLSDGNRIVNSTTVHIYRDGQGRIRHEATLPALGGNANPPTLVTISDPVSGVNYSLDPREKVAWKMPSPKFGDEQFAKIKMHAATLAPPMGPMTFTTTIDGPRGDAKPSVSREDLGVQQIQGVNAQGTRETTVIPAATFGNERPLTITSERWFSPDLKIELKTVRNDPRMGETSLTVSDLTRGEPDPSLFQVPSDYTVQDGMKPGKQIFEYHKAQ